MDRLQQRLELIANLLPGETINVSTETVVYRQSWLGILSRRCNNENRHTTAAFVVDTIMEAMKYNTLKPQLRDAVMGMSILRETYADSVSVFSTLVKAECAILEHLGLPRDHHMVLLSDQHPRLYSELRGAECV